MHACIRCTTALWRPTTARKHSRTCPGFRGRGSSTTCWKPHAYEQATVTACLTMYVHLYIPAYLLYAWQAVAYLDSGVW